ncbi:MAG TPA: hypothetical protein VMH41_13540 [Mycobacteriales bacterium]|nr:hypothetical protein [Mycobacteriales bacterium]
MTQWATVRTHPNTPAAFGNLLANLVLAALAVWFCEAIGALDRGVDGLVAVGVMFLAVLSWLQLAFWRSLVVGETPRSRINPGYVTLSLLLSVLVLGGLLAAFAIGWGLHLLV